MATFVRQRSPAVPPVYGAWDGFESFMRDCNIDISSDEDATEEDENELMADVKKMDAEGRVMITDHGLFLLFNLCVPVCDFISYIDKYLSVVLTDIARMRPAGSGCRSRCASTRYWSASPTSCACETGILSWPQVEYSSIMNHQMLICSTLCRLEYHAPRD